MQRITSTSEVELDAEQIAGLFDAEFEGFCPVCMYETLNEGEVICCGCFEEALAYHTNTCGCCP